MRDREERGARPHSAAREARRAAGRKQAIGLIGAANVDRSAVERLRTEHMQLADAASKRVTQALADIAEVLTPAQREEGDLRLGTLEIDLGAREVRVRGVAKALTSYQFALLAALAAHPGRVLSREAILDLVKGEPREPFDRSIDVHISRIRQAIEDDPRKRGASSPCAARATCSRKRRIEHGRQ